MIILTILQTLILIFLGSLHIYWALGGKWGFTNSIPIDENGKRVLNPKKIDSAVVGIGLFLFSFFYLVKGDLVNLELPHWAFISAGWFISSIFLLRAMGDFKYVGFFKKNKLTRFAKLDSYYFSPLCLTLGLNGLLIESINWYK